MLGRGWMDWTAKALFELKSALIQLTCCACGFDKKIKNTTFVIIAKQHWVALLVFLNFAIVSNPPPPIIYLLFMLIMYAGMVMERNRARIRNIGPLYRGDREHGGWSHLHPHHEQHRSCWLPNHLQLHRMEQFRLWHGDHSP